MSDKKFKIIIKEGDIKIRIPIYRPGHVHKDKTKYNRKKKHKKKDFERFFTQND